jgi:uncharacterized membrane protein
MADEKRGGLYKLFDALAKIAAVAFLLALAMDTITSLLFYWNVQIPVETLATIKQVADYVLLYGGLVMAGLVALEFGFKHNLVFLIIILVLLALVILPQFFPEVWKSVEQAIT